MAHFFTRGKSLGSLDFTGRKEITEHRPTRKIWRGNQKGNHDIISARKVSFFILKT